MKKSIEPSAATWFARKVRHGTVKLTRIVRDPPFDVGLQLLFSKHTSLRSTQERSGFSTDGGEPPVADDAPHEGDSERGRAHTRIVARERWI